jgi:hypothetical protein
MNAMKRVFSFKLDEDLWRKMKENPMINWSEVIRNAIAERLEATRNRRIGYAVKQHMKVLAALYESSADSTDLVRRFRGDE